jgi:outer membrane protein OmpA-like peptidoglycan-associated protein
VQPVKGDAVTLSQPYALATVTGRGAETGTSSPQEVRSRYGALLDALPARPTAYLLYFESGGDQLVGQSQGELAKVVAAFRQTPAAELVIIGHTDTVGTEAVNDAISRRRAEAVRNQLVALGIDASRIEAVGRGKREPLVQTGDGVEEARNRRVEIRLR